MIKPEERSFGQFGEGVDPIHVARKKRKKRTYLVFFLLAFFLPSVVYTWHYVQVNFLEKNRPKISLVSSPEGVGEQPAELELLIEDADSGLSEIFVRFEQKRLRGELLKHSFTERRLRKKTISLRLDGPALGLREGDVRLSIVAFDKSYWSNTKKADLYLTVDYKKPDIKIITKQHNAVHGGAELVFYKVTDNDKSFEGISGVRMGSWLFPGFSASALSEDFSRVPELHFTYFPVPLDYNPKKGKIEVFARDSVGNFTTSSMRYRVGNLKTKRVSYELPPDFLEHGVEKLYQTHLKGLGEELKPDEAVTSIDELVSRFRTINVEYRRVTERNIRALLAKPKQSKYWREKFILPSGFRRIYGFGELQSYNFEGLSAGSVVSGGLGFNSKNSLPVRAANAGVVVFSGELGPFGDSIIIDHGFGLSTVYGNLHARQKVEGDSVSKTEEIGLSGRSGLFLLPGLHYEVRLHGVPVRPEEWSDSRWVKGHIIDKIVRVRKMLGIRENSTGI